MPCPRAWQFKPYNALSFEYLFAHIYTVCRWCEGNLNAKIIPRAEFRYRGWSQLYLSMLTVRATIEEFIKEYVLVAVPIQNKF